MTAPVMTRDYNKQDQDTTKPAAPSRPVAPATPPTWNVPPQPVAPPQPITPIRQAAAPEPASASPVPSIGASGDFEGQTILAATAPLPSSSFSPPACPRPRQHLTRSGSGPGSDRQFNEPATALAQSETPLSTSGDTTPRRDDEVVLDFLKHRGRNIAFWDKQFCRAAVHRAHRPWNGSAAACGGCDHGGRAGQSADRTPATIPTNITRSAAQPAPQSQTNNARSCAASNLPPAGTGSDRVVENTGFSEREVQRRLRPFPTPASKPATSGSQQPVGQDAKPDGVMSSPTEDRRYSVESAGAGLHGVRRDRCHAIRRAAICPGRDRA